jgi:phosphoserine phosphatase
MTTGAVLFVDLDGTLVATDLLHECVRCVLRTRPHRFALTALEVWRGRAHVKRRLTELATIAYPSLPYRPEVVELLRSRRPDYEEIVLATAADHAHAVAIARHTGLFVERVIASDGSTNTKGATKLAAMRAHAAGRPFDYMGDSWADVPIFAAVNAGYLVNPSARLERAVRDVCPNLTVISCGPR